MSAPTLTKAPVESSRAEVRKAASRDPGQRPRRRRTPLWLTVLLVLVGLVFLIPAYWMITAALKPNSDIYQWPLNFWPNTFTWDNFANAFAAAPFDRFFMNSIVITTIGATFKVAMAVCTAYAFAFLQFPGKKWMFLGILGALMVPGHVTLLINYITIGNLGLINSYAGIILPGLGSAFGTFLLRQHFLSLPAEVMEAAELDGAGHLRRLFSFVLPMSIPAVVTVALIAVIDDWNEFIWPMLITNTVEMRTMPIGLMYLKQTEGMNDWGVIMAGTVLVVLPMLLLFLAAQRFIVAGLAGTVVKR